MIIEQSTINYVREVLEEMHASRDNDLILLANVWRKAIPDIHNWSYLRFEQAFEKGDLPHFESIRRMRQKLQEENPYLRGYKYSYRKNILQKNVKNQIYVPELHAGGTP